MFCPVISIVEVFGTSVDTELYLAFSVAEPVKAHVHGFSAFRLDLAIDNAFGSGVVSLKGCGWLFMTEPFEDNANEDGFARHNVKGREFGFCSGSHDHYWVVC